MVNEKIVFGSCAYCKKEVSMNNFGKLHLPPMKTRHFIVCSKKVCVKKYAIFFAKSERYRLNRLWMRGVAS